MTDPVVLLSTGDVVGPNAATDGTMVLFDGTSGKRIRGNNAVVTAQGLALLDDPDAASNRATIGLDQVNNTSDLNKPVSNATQAALNLKWSVPPGTVIEFAGYNAPAGTFIANGTAVSRTVYADLFAVIGTIYGAGNGSTTFNLPDYRGVFRRGLDSSRGTDPGRTLGPVQFSQNLWHVHGAGIGASGYHGHSASTNVVGNHTHSAWTDAQGEHTHQVKEGSNHPRWPGNPAMTSGDDYTGEIAYYSSTLPAGSHGHNIGMSATGDHGHAVYVDAVGAHVHSVDIYGSGIEEARPVNMATLVCIKY